MAGDVVDCMSHNAPDYCQEYRCQRNCHRKQVLGETLARRLILQAGEGGSLMEHTNSEEPDREVNVRAETRLDHESIRDVNKAAFYGDAEAMLADSLRSSSFYIPGLSLLAELGGQVVGHILFPSISIESASGNTAALALAPVAVHPKHQRRGIGTLLVRKGLDEAQRLGHRIVVVVGHPSYYPRFGFTPARDRGIESPYPVPDEAFMALELAPGAMDGVDGMVRYPPPFDDAS